MQFTINIKELKVYALIGCYDWEKDVRQLIIINIDLSFQSNKKIISLADTVNYHHLSDNIKDFLKFKRYELLESLLSDLADYIMTHNIIIDQCYLSISKPYALDNLAHISVSITKSRSDYPS